jgi:iron(II)-dependent oxidoreductase
MQVSSPVHETLRRDLAKARAETDHLFEMIAPAAMYERPIPERHRIIFYLGHLEAFDWNMVCVASFGTASFHPDFDRLFAFGIDPTDGGLPDDRPGDWPGVEEVRTYCRRVREKVDDFLHGVTFTDEGRMFRVAIEHRLMHAETLAYMWHWLPFESKARPAGAGFSRPARRPKPAPAHIPEGVATLGQRRKSFGWDNEFGAQEVFVPAFSIDALNVTNGQFLEFVRSGGYEERSLWSEEAWEWIRDSEIGHPKFWTERNNQWFYRTMFEEVPLPLSWPVYVSHAEAEAYARSLGESLPTEAQYHRAAFGSGDSAAAQDGNYDFRSWTPHAVGALPSGRSPFGVYDLVGNGWEWTGTKFAPFPGFQAFPFYPGYSADFFDGKHFVLKGASPRTAAALVRPSFRNWFQPHYPNVYAGFRCVQN